MSDHSYTYEDVIRNALASTTQALGSNDTSYDKALIEDFRDDLHEKLGEIEKLKELSVL